MSIAFTEQKQHATYLAIFQLSVHFPFSSHSGMIHTASVHVARFRVVLLVDTDVSEYYLVSIFRARNRLGYVDGLQGP
jgi:hypothetical protein